ncbi:unnamed protein product [Nippostrongylus brasiliensis]|uniref:RSN1_7TM domain-containing protein n=1 Tax=Nippostrongylus brasiliensis TaxID=27835 RepID=A0A0N4XZP6_NIPBR|nr:unnamed protein product [Nippostrongylus brasiliensis]
MVTFCFAHDDIAAVRAAVVENLGYNVEGECVTGHLSILHWKTLFTILNTAVTIVPVYAVILLIRRAIVLKVDGLSQNLSRNTRLMHDQLLKALYYQACLPIFFLFGSITYAIGQLKIYNHPILEYSTFIIAGIVPVLSPLTSLLFIRPYYTWFIRVLKFEKAKVTMAPEQMTSTFVFFVQHALH